MKLTSTQRAARDALAALDTRRDTHAAIQQLRRAREYCLERNQARLLEKIIDVGMQQENVEALSDHLHQFAGLREDAARQGK